MKRLRLALAVLVLALALPIGLLVARALRSVSIEETIRHETVAARVFDEMERSLSEFLEREEARPVGAYGFYGWRDALESDSTRPMRSPLSHPAPEPFVVAHFQIDPDGSWHTPLRPRDTRTAERFGDWPASESERDRIDRGLIEIEAEVVPFWKRMAERRQALEMQEAVGELLGQVRAKQERPARTRPMPRSLPSDTLGLAKAAGDKNAEVAEEEAEGVEQVVVGREADRDLARVDEKKVASKKSTYEVLQSFNRGAEQRRERKSVVTEAPRESKYQLAKRRAPAPVMSPSQDLAEEVSPSSATASVMPATEAMRADADELTESEPAGKAKRDARVPTSPHTTDQRSNARFSRSLEDANSVLDGLSSRKDYVRAAEVDPAVGFADDESVPGIAGGRVKGSDAPIRIVRDPMVGVALGGEHVMLYRTVLVDQQGYRQGLLIDSGALRRWLNDQVIESSPLRDSVVLEFEGDTGSPAAPANYYLSDHSFAEPFDALRARLAVEPLEGGSSANTIYALAALLAIVALGGLLAVDRMVAVVVHFAERRSNFVAAVSHELKTPLTAIRMYGEMLRDGLVSSDEKRHEYYGTISDESERLSRLIDNVLEFSRLEKGNREFSMSAGPIGGLVQEIAEKLRPHAQREGFALSVEVDPELPPVRFDRDALFQMIFNLVDNAMKYAKDADRHEVVIRCARDDRGSVQLSVRDYGPGVSRRMLGKVFEPFFRGEEELTRTAKGSGIGLALVKELGEAMGAAVTGANVEDGGFRVSIAFPPQPLATA